MLKKAFLFCVISSLCGKGHIALADGIIIPLTDSLIMSDRVAVFDPNVGPGSIESQSTPSNATAPYLLPSMLVTSSEMPGVQTNTGGLVIASITGSGFVGANGIDSSGQFHASATALAESDGPINNPFGGIFPVGSNASFSGDWTDTLFLASNTLPFGTPVLLKLTNTTHSFVGVGAGPNQSAEVLSFIGLDGINATGFAEADVVNTDTHPRNGTQISAAYFTGFVGEDLQLSEQLILDTDASSSFINTLGHDSFADASDIAGATIDILTPNVTYISASGITYTSTEAPEPSEFIVETAAVIAIGLAYALRRRGYVKESLL